MKRTLLTFFLLCQPIVAYAGINFGLDMAMTSKVPEIRSEMEALQYGIGINGDRHKTAELHGFVEQIKVSIALLSQDLDKANKQDDYESIADLEEELDELQDDLLLYDEALRWARIDTDEAMLEELKEQVGSVVVSVNRRATKEEWEAWNENRH